VVLQRALRPDSGGPGRYRGGLGVIQQVEVLAPAFYQTQNERTHCPPWGLMGGGAALSNRVVVTRNDGTIEEFPTGKVNPTRLEPGDGYITQTGGGGGFWPAFERDPERVLGDVRSGYVSVDAAERDYGVVIRQFARRYEIDRDATTALRAQGGT
jgi:N-methylhydantoinase B